ncbi:MAG: M48 metallopeptidase family protein [Chloroflexota bacterium]
MSHVHVPDNESLAEPINTDAFKEEVRGWAEKVGVQPAEIHVRPMRRKWASCSSRGRLTFDAELLSQPAAFRDEVVVHELLHLKVPNHGPLFKALLRAYASGYQRESI